MFVAGSLAANLMPSVLRILKQGWGFFSSLENLKLNLPLKGKIRAFLAWDFRMDR
jgi:hypothetical protein